MIGAGGSGIPAPTRCGEVWPGMHCPACRYDGGQSCFRRCRCPCHGCAVGRVWYTPDHAELNTYEPPETPYDDQGDMEEQTRWMDAEWSVDHDLLQHQDNFTELAEDAAEEPADRGRSTHTAVHRASGRAGSAGADSRQATSRVQRKRRMQDDKLEKHIYLEKLKPEGLEQIVTPEELHCLQRRYHQQKGVVPARSRDEYVQEAATPRGGDDMVD